jgi:hypothetical protein
VLTVTSTAPAVEAGLLAWIQVSLDIPDQLVAGIPPKVTKVTPVRFVPLRVTSVPPEIVPFSGEILVIDGPDAKVKASFVATKPPVPENVVILTVAFPATCAGVIAVIEVAVEVPTMVAAVLLKVTELAPVRFVPVIVTVVPPLTVPFSGEIDVKVGDPAKVYAFCLVMAPPAALTIT